MKIRLLTAACLMALTYGSANADTINVLWYSGGGYSSGDESTISGLAASSVAVGGNTWNLQYWDGTGSIPSGTWNVMVVASDISFSPNFTGLNNFLSTATLGDRIMVSGQDADFHYDFNSSTGAGGNSHTQFNSAQGFLVDAINWAGSGTGMGMVFEGDNMNTFSTENSALSGLGTQSGPTGLQNVNIPGAYASFPINTGLTSAGLSDWNQSYHYYWTGSNASLWTPINTSGDVSGAYVTLVSAGTAGGGLTSAAPEPASVTLAGMGLVALLGFARRRRQHSPVV